MRYWDEYPEYAYGFRIERLELGWFELRELVAELQERCDEQRARLDVLGEVVKGLAELWKRQDRGLQNRIAEQQKHLDALTIALVTVAERFARTMGREDAEGFINEVDAQLNGDGGESG